MSPNSREFLLNRLKEKAEVIESRGVKMSFNKAFAEDNSEYISGVSLSLLFVTEESIELLVSLQNMILGLSENTQVHSKLSRL